MAEVQAVKDLDTVKLISYLLKRTYGQQIADVWDVGLNLALRISDLLSIKFENINDERLALVEGKTSKQATIKLNDKARSIIARIKDEHPEHVYLFQSYRNQWSKTVSAKPLSRRYVSRAFAAIGEEVGVDLGTHSMRKTRGYHLYKNTKDIARVMKMLRHSSEAVTLRYIGITQEDVDRDFAELEL
ncbi:MAG: tyrosine-type recombinase/integrase [Pseudomonadota bacterium]|uniref:tyrosine-type recombinase/integrase n=1 Tax=Idiomarina sp. TaxID=1874361 RepID=UPI0025848AC1|nr:tyrosine-type recombinase/integrase [Idiomarina sp.]MEC7643841.1 tyrosine-type recombinase/integrase [Pseudomonadota bacterium]